MQKNDYFKNEIQQQIHETIMNDPGLHSREMSRQLQIPYSTLKYHLGCLEKQGAIMTEREGKFLHYYSADTTDSMERKVVSVLRKEPAKQIVLFLLTQGYSTQRDLSKNLKERRTTIEFYLKKLLKLDIIIPVIVSKGKIYRTKKPKNIKCHPDGHEGIYILKDAESTFTLLRKYLTSLFH